MKNLFELINESKNITVNERHNLENDPKPEDVVGKDAEKNKTGGRWAIDEPIDNEPMEELTKEDMNRNIKRLLMKFDAEEPFFIIGEAGWAKTSIIKNMAKRFKRRVITVYLDKALKEDLGGQPIPMKDKNNDAVVETAMPGWAAYMKNHPKEKFLLFFDEMNQADPGVMNALMPIVLETEICGYKFDNFMVGAAGNFDYENDVNALSGPLESRFKPIIVWETNTEDTWNAAMKYLYKQYKDEIPTELLDTIKKNVSLFKNPREIDHKVLRFAMRIKGSKHVEFYDTEDYLERLEGVTRDDLTRTQQDNLKQIAEMINEFVKGNLGKGKDDNKDGGENNQTSSRRGRGSKDNEMMSEEAKQLIKRAVERGYISDNDGGKIVKYGISKENINLIFCDPEYTEEPVNKEMLDRYLRKLKADGIDFKYETNADWKKAGLLDPTGEE